MFMELPFGLIVVWLGLLYLMMLLLMWKVRTVEYVIFKILFLLVIILFAALSGSTIVVLVWIVNLGVQFVILGGTLLDE
ncbi:hypothetical protein A3K29_05035 [Candidatus Collierbacteria bacterium RIFOXYB2_FULL_46_14]|uniref:Uncharacterized protein n=1 Tax=Candidatus Collierbacteria bacterium GW2011_GWA2_46_26 TaxID=1618381 RepID=A0A0G1PJR2_9BACT|nr:MAG: hypothetical protein UX47_C0006G0030 [Candidatus Collierbacteria bacterium GW2011_GWA2_46_26]OGD73461.1 MAG: hypothetical protein A3K29_05035 [Candidatus Collierbacteria bacterium RIFOXYB2_FULL_46_14]OGD76503.1 MAG: hypothetical protein A3K43_05035 [Candidatus Collierbacteria bacterium RIFOXYA2_FULL_46_20]OGD77839.1 MAG: hypothetical protein A3K39_05035 [Candidatus Collierbacteria bacterium RIFOXYC2_FULL_43_15]OGD81130.1 MAG: hypothetical protein A2320_05535 [Pseudomonadales bacterium G